MKIAVVSIGSFDTQYSDYHIMRDIIIGLLEHGEEVTLIQKQYLDEPKYPKSFYKYLGKQLHVHNIHFQKKEKADLKARYIADLLYYRKACQAMKKDLPDKIFLQSNNTAFYTIFYAKHVLKRPVLYNEQDIFPENAFFAGILSEKSFIYRIAYILQKYAYKNATALTTISDDMKDTIIKRYHISSNKVQVIYNWGHEELSANPDTQNRFLKKYPKKPNEYRIIYAGNLGKMQNVELILQAANCLKENSNITFYIIGDGANKKSLETYARTRKLQNVVFLGMQPSEYVADLYRSADVNVIPLQNGLIYAALPSKTADCLLARKPIITCVDEDSQFVAIIKKYGFINSPPRSPEALAEAILHLQKNQTEMKSTLLWNHLFSSNENVAKHVSSILAMDD